MCGLTKNDSGRIKFVLSCFIAGSIDRQELRKWGEQVIAQSDDFPDYMLDLISFDQPRFHIYKTIGFVPSDTLTENVRQTIDQLAAYRKGIAPEDTSSEKIFEKGWLDIEAVERFNQEFKNVVEPIPLEIYQLTSEPSLHERI